MFCLRDYANDELITEETIDRKLQAGASFKLVSSPIIEAAEMVERVSNFISIA